MFSLFLKRNVIRIIAQLANVRTSFKKREKIIKFETMQLKTE